MVKKHASMLIGNLAKEANVTIGTIRYYQKERILDDDKRDNLNRRIFDEDDLKWLTFITYLRDTGMSIKEIRNYKGLMAKGSQTIDERIQIIKKQKELVINSIAEKKKQLKALDHKLNKSQEQQNKYI